MTEVLEAAPAADQAASQAQVTRNVRIVRALHRSCYVSPANPRTVIDKLYISFLAGSIKAQGILQRPLAREVTGDGGELRYELIFGQCRFLANSMNYGPNGFIDLDVCEMTDEEAKLAAQTENTVRAPMTAVEEAEGAANLLAQYQGDREMTAKELGWARSKLDTMLKLMACSERVRKQLVDAAEPLGKMPIGVAELLAGLPYAQQDKCMDAFARRGGFPAIDTLRAEIQQLSKSLNAAIFDKGDCAQCPHNSAQQRAMFDTGLDDGFCLKGACYEEKTEGELASRVASLKDDYQTIKIVRPGDNYSVIKLVVDGPGGVGEDQALACRSCSNFGAAVSGVPDKLGKVVRALCFDTACNQQKVLAHQATIAPPESATPVSTEEAAGKVVDKKPASTAAGKDKPADANSKAKAETPTVSLTSAVLEYRDRLYRTVIVKEIAAAPERGFAMLLALAASRRLSAVPADTMIAALSQHGGSGLHTGMLGKNYTAAMGLSLEKLSSFVSKMGATCADTLTRDELVDMVKQIKPEWRAHFTLGEDLLKVLTKSEIQAVAINVGLDTAYGKEFKSLFAKKKDEIIAALTGVKDFDYVGALPSVLKPSAAKR